MSTVPPRAGLLNADKLIRGDSIPVPDDAPHGFSCGKLNVIPASNYLARVSIDQT